MLFSTWKRFQNLVRELGAGATILYLSDRCLRRLNKGFGFYFYHFFAQPLADQPRLPLHRGKAYSFRLLLTPEPLLERLGRPSAVIDGRFEQGAQCLSAIKNDVLVGCIWFVRDAYQEDEVNAIYALPPGVHCVWDFDVFVAESERLGFLFAKQWDTFDALLEPQGVRYTVSRINAFNQRSIDSHRRLGAKKCGWALFLRMGPMQWMISDRRPFLAWGGCPVLQVGPHAPNSSEL